MYWCHYLPINISMIFNTQSFNTRLQQRYPEKYNQVLQQRNYRTTVSATETRGKEFERDPLEECSRVQQSLDKLNEYKVSGVTDPKLFEAIERTETQLKSGNCARPDTPEWEYRQRYLIHMSTWVWPSPQELETRRQEKYEMFKLIGENVPLEKVDEFDGVIKPSIPAPPPSSPTPVVPPSQNIVFTESHIQEQRYAICKECPEFVSLTTQCKQCGCIMQLKTRYAGAVCPLKKW